MRRVAPSLSAGRLDAGLRGRGVEVHPWSGGHRRARGDDGRGCSGAWPRCAVISRSATRLVSLLEDPSGSRRADSTP